MSDYIEKSEGVYLLNYVESALNDIEYHTKNLIKYLDSAIACVSAGDQTLLDVLGNQFRAEMDMIDEITVDSLYDEQRIFPATYDYLYLNDYFDPSITFPDPSTDDPDSLFKRGRFNYSFFQPDFTTIFNNRPENGTYTYVNVKLSSASDSPNDILAYDGTLKYYNRNADNWVTLLIPCMTVNGLFSRCHLDDLDWADPYGVQTIAVGPNNNINPFGVLNPLGGVDSMMSFYFTSAGGGRVENKLRVLRQLIGNEIVNTNYTVIDGSDRRIILGDDTLSEFTRVIDNVRGLERIRLCREFINIQRELLTTKMSGTSSVVVANDLNSVNNSIPEDIRITQVLNSEIDLSNMIPQFISEAFPDAAEFMQFFQDYLNKMYYGERNYVLSSGSGTYSVSYGRTSAGDTTLYDTSDITIPDEQRISILEKIKRLSELHDPELIDFEYLSHFANVLGYNISGFSTNFNDAFTALNTGYTFDDDVPKDISIDAKKYIRFFISNLPSFYRIKSTNNCIKVLLYSFGLIGDIINVYSTDYYNKWKSSKNVWTGTEIKEDLNILRKQEEDGVWFPTPHFRIGIDLVRSITNTSFDIKKAEAIFRAIDAVRPIHTVFDGIVGYFYTYSNLYVIPEPPVTMVLGADPMESQRNIFTGAMLVDNFKYLSSQNLGGAMPDDTISSVWANGWTTSAMTSANFTNLPDSGNIVLLENFRSSAVPQYGTLKLDYSYLAKPQMFLSLTTGTDNRTTIVAYPNDNKTDNLTFSARFQFISSVPTTASFAALGFNYTNRYSVSTLQNQNLWYGLRYTSAGDIELYRSQYWTGTSSVPEATLTLPITFSSETEITLKIVRRKYKFNYSTPGFRYEIKFLYFIHDDAYDKYEEFETIDHSYKTSVITKSVEQFPFCILDCRNRPMADLRQDIGITGLALMT